MKKAIVVLMTWGVVLAGMAQAQTSQNTKKTLETLSGSYVDPKGVDWGRGTFGTREFSFKDGKWTLTFVLAFDPEMKNQIFVFRTFGNYKVIEPSKTVKGAYNAIFYEDKKFVTLKNDDPNLVEGFGFKDCMLKKDQEKDISISGCSLWKPVAVCNEDHELLSIDASGKLYFGIRPPDNDMCTADKRPTALNVAVVKK